MIKMLFKTLAWSLSKASERSWTCWYMSIRSKLTRSVRICPRRLTMTARSSKIPVKTASMLVKDLSIEASAAARSSALIWKLLVYKNPNLYQLKYTYSEFLNLLQNISNLECSVHGDNNQTFVDLGLERINGVLKNKISCQNYILEI